MKTMCAVLAMCVAMTALGSAQQSTLTKEDVVKLVKAGVGDDVIIAKIDQEKATFNLSADDLAALKELKASDKLIQRMMVGAKPVEKPAPQPAAGKNIQLNNVSHRAVNYAVNEKDMLINFSASKGTELATGASVELGAKAGDYRVAIEGRPTTEHVQVPDQGSCTMTVRGADTSYIDVQTIVVEDADGRHVVILHSEGKAPEGTLHRDTTSRRVVVVETFYGPQISFLPQVSDTVLLGAGIGAIIGHQTGHRTRGAIIGAAAALLLESMRCH